MDSVPVIDFGKLQDVPCPESDPTWIKKANEIRKACGEIGFFQIINHGFPADCINEAFHQSKEFFALDKETKMMYEKPEIKSINEFYGYTRPGREIVEDNVMEYRETFDWLEGRGKYPDKELPKFSPTLNWMHEECKTLAKRVYRLWAIGLGLDDVDFFVKKSRHFIDPVKYSGLEHMRIAYYPPIDDEDNITPNTVRIGEHTDTISITFVFQDNSGGLEVKNADGKWVKLTPVPGAIICNTGDLIEFWTAGLFLATPHRVLLPPPSDPKRKQARYSIMYFEGCDEMQIVSPLEINKTPEEEERLAKRNKTYPSKPIVANDHCFGKVNIFYGLDKVDN